MQHIASLEIDACKTKEVAWETRVKELETYKLQTMKMYQKVKKKLQKNTLSYRRSLVIFKMKIRIHKRLLLL